MSAAPAIAAHPATPGSWAPRRPKPVARPRHLRLVAVSAPQPRPALRATVRGRRVTALILLACAVLAIVVATATAGADVGPAEVVTVGPGQTLSDVARAELPQLPVGTAVAQLQVANGLNSLEVSAGQRLVIPAAE